MEEQLEMLITLSVQSFLNVHHVTLQIINLHR